MSETKKKWGFKKGTYTYSKWGRYDPRGKGSAEKTEMINELRTVVQILSKRIDKIKAASAYSKQLWEEEKKAILQKAREDKQEALKELRREKNKEKTEERRALGVKSLKSKLATRDARLASVEKEKDELKKELRLAKRREERLRKRVDASLAQLKKKWDKRIVEKEVVPEELRAYLKFIEKPFDRRGLNAVEVAVKTTRFITNNNLKPDDLGVLSELNVYGAVTADKIDTKVTKTTLSSMVKRGLLNKQMVGGKANYFLTAGGEEIITNYINYISYGKIDRAEA